MGIFLGVIAVLIVYGIAASKFEKIAVMKGHSGYFWYCFFLGIAGWLMVIALPDRTSKDELADSAEKLSNIEEIADNGESKETAFDDDTLPPI